MDIPNGYMGSGTVEQSAFLVSFFSPRYRVALTSPVSKPPFSSVAVLARAQPLDFDNLSLLPTLYISSICWQAALHLKFQASIFIWILLQFPGVCYFK